MAARMRLPANLRLSLYGTGALVALSGIAWLWGHYFAGETLSRRVAAVSMEIHGGAMMLVLVLVGSAAALHAPTGWREKKNRRSGALLASVLATLTATGFLLYYLGDERARAAASVLHWAVGLLSPVILAAHIRLGRSGPA